jgi:hypothetical protein
LKKKKNTTLLSTRGLPQVSYVAEKVLGSVTIHPNFIYFEGQLQKQVT